MTDPQCIQSSEKEQTEINAKGKSLVVEYPLKIYIGNLNPQEDEPGYVQCITDRGLEVFYYSEDEHQFEQNAVNWMKEAIFNPTDTVEAQAPHIISHAIGEGLV